ncbi:MAG: type II toxin-antitoxin system VapC family toxin [bacterium]
MEKQKVYIETSVISYLTAKPSRDIIIAGHQQTTYDWWHKTRHQFDCFISEFVIDEINLGDKEAAEKRIKAVNDFRYLEFKPEVEQLGIEYFRLFNIPEKSKLDALHLAIAVWYKIDYLLSWNCKHIANAYVNLRLREYNDKNNLHSPILCTPDELMEVNYV